VLLWLLLLLLLLLLQLLQVEVEHRRINSLLLLSLRLLQALCCWPGVRRRQMLLGLVVMLGVGQQGGVA
jgi:hypothetical protein